MRVLGDEGQLGRDCCGLDTDLWKVSMACPGHSPPYLQCMVWKAFPGPCFMALTAVALGVIQQVAEQACCRASASRKITAESLTGLFLLLVARKARKALFHYDKTKCLSHMQGKKSTIETLIDRQAAVGMELEPEGSEPGAPAQPADEAEAEADSQFCCGPRQNAKSVI